MGRGSEERRVSGTWNKGKALFPEVNGMAESGRDKDAQPFTYIL